MKNPTHKEIRDNDYIKKWSIECKIISECSDVMPKDLISHQSRIYNACLDMAYLFEEKLRSRDAEILEWAKNYIKYTNEEVAELNKDLPNTLQESALYQSDGMRKVIADLQAFIQKGEEKI